jgi:hypothetical protein
LFIRHNPGVGKTPIESPRFWTDRVGSQNRSTTTKVQLIQLFPREKFLSLRGVVRQLRGADKLKEKIWSNRI